MSELHQIGSDPDGRPVFIDHHPSATVGMQYADGTPYTGYVFGNDLLEDAMEYLSKPMGPDRPTGGCIRGKE